MKFTTKLTDREIVLSILEGDERALLIFYGENKNLVFSYIQSRVSGLEDCEEILQDTFIAATQRLRDFTYKSSLSTYLIAIARNKIVDFYRKRRVVAVVFSRFDGVEELVSKLLRPDEEFESEELRRGVEKVFKKLRPKYKRILKLKYVEGCSVLEIAQSFKESVKGIESALFRARREFCQAYTKWENYQGSLKKNYSRG